MQIDHIIYQIVIEIFRDEEEHEEDLEASDEYLQNLTKKFFIFRYLQSLKYLEMIFVPFYW